MKKVNIMTMVLGFSSLMSCSSQHFAFSDSSQWYYNKKTATVENKVDGTHYQFFQAGMEPVNITEQTYVPNFITGSNFNKEYKGYKLLHDCLSDVPVRIEAVDFILADRYVLATLASEERQWQPDYTIDLKEGSLMLMENGGMMDTSHGDFMKRNIIRNARDKRVVCVDRFILGGKPKALIYYCQSEMKKYPFASLFHWTTTRFENLQMLGVTLDFYKSLSEKNIRQNK